MRSSPLSRQSSWTASMYAGSAGTTPPSPWMGSSMTAETVGSMEDASESMSPYVA
jgi:hypothetical protein